ncbi:MAG: phosphotransferase, partial [Cryobacterium sp.]|nr:phosphotransferase [Oligoflexia bacterium]
MTAILKPPPSTIGLEIRDLVDTLDRDEGALESWVKNSAKIITHAEKIPGDASTRRYYRIETKDQSNIMMKMECFTEFGMKLPFLTVQNHLAMNGIDVPAVLDVDPERGIILLEDLGDVTLLRRLQEVSTPDVERGLYEQVIDSLVDLQLLASPKVGAPELEAFKLRFDHEKLMWETNFTIEHFYKTYLARDFRPQDLKTLTTRFSEICQALADQPTVFTHRDFHSRNIMAAPVSKGDTRLVMIDFQDGRMGPAQYDLAS